MSYGINLPFTSNARLKVEEADFTVTAIPPGHMTETSTISSHRVAFINRPRGTCCIAATRWRKQIKQFNSSLRNNDILYILLVLSHLSAGGKMR